jgi:hypothetical protein
MSALTVIPTLLLLAWLWRRIREESDADPAAGPIPTRPAPDAPQAG